MLLNDENVKSLTQLLDKRSQFYFKLDKTSPPISDTEVDLLCLLLEVNLLYLYWCPRKTYSIGVLGKRTYLPCTTI